MSDTAAPAAATASRRRIENGVVPALIALLPRAVVVLDANLGLAAAHGRAIAMPGCADEQALSATWPGPRDDLGLRDGVAPIRASARSVHVELVPVDDAAGDLAHLDDKA